MVLSGAILSQQLRASRREGQQKGVWSLLQRGERGKERRGAFPAFPVRQPQRWRWTLSLLKCLLGTSSPAPLSVGVQFSVLEAEVQDPGDGRFGSW